MRGFLQLALDLFDASPAPAPRRAPEIHGAFQPAQPIASVMAPAHFSHPRANRETRLQEAQVAYEFRRGKRRTIGMAVGADGLVVSAPRWVPLYEVEAALQEKAGWIVRKLEEMQERHQRLEATRIEWRDGASFPFLGEMVTVVLDPRQDYKAVGGGLKAGDVEVVLRGDTHAIDCGAASGLRLHIGLPHHAEAGQIRDAVQAWLMRQAHCIFTERLHHFAPLLQVQWRRLALSNAGTRWGSAHSDGSIRLNWRLVHFKRSVLDYVVVHELSHLRVMDHSPRFWETVGSVMPEYKRLRAALKDDLVPRWR
ncbi:MAG: M48 family metallopeptidase [Hylemonella sp.]|nr:M48 family metallopeptidase [Hylemonella sp.]